MIKYMLCIALVLSSFSVGVADEKTTDEKITEAIEREKDFYARALERILAKLLERKVYYRAEEVLKLIASVDEELAEDWRRKFVKAEMEAEASRKTGKEALQGVLEPDAIVGTWQLKCETLPNPWILTVKNDGTASITKCVYKWKAYGKRYVFTQTGIDEQPAPSFELVLKSNGTLLGVHRFMRNNKHMEWTVTGIRRHMMP